MKIEDKNGRNSRVKKIITTNNKSLFSYLRF